MDYVLLGLKFFVALLIGLIIGFEREYHEKKRKKIVISGVRTFTLVSLFGFLLTFFMEARDITFLFTYGLVILIFFSIPILKSKTTKPGFTTAISLVIVFNAGILVGLGLILEAVIITAIIVPLLAYKEEIHSFASFLSKEDLMGALRFLSVAAILLPITYTIGDINAFIGPGKMFDPIKTVLMILFVSSISFTSYVIIKTIGSGKGLELTSFLGGFVSSAASTASVSNKAKKNPNIAPLSSSSIILTNTSMILKDMILIAFLTGFIVIQRLLLPIILIIIVSVIYIIHMQKKSRFKSFIDLDLGSPFAILPAAKFAFLFSVISIVTYLLKYYLGPYGVYAAAIGGLVSTTTVTASLGSLFAAGEIGLNTTVSTFLLTTAIGSLSKIGISAIYDKNISKRISVPLLLISLTAFLTFIFFTLTAK